MNTVEDPGAPFAEPVALRPVVTDPEWDERQMAGSWESPLDGQGSRRGLESSATSYAPIDLAAIDTADVEPPSILARTDGLALLYAGRITWVSGEAEANKGWIMAAAAGQILEAGGRVAWHDGEDHERTFVERFLALGVDRAVINDPDRVRYIRPAEPLHDKGGRLTPAAADFADTCRWLTGHYSLAVIDGVTEHMQIEGLDPNNGTDVASWLRRIPRPLAASGAAVPCIDHVVKDREGRGRYAIGSVHKLNGVDGAAFTVEAVQRFGRATGAEPVEGLSRILLAKDRPGWIRGRVGKDQPVADVHLTAWPDGGVTVKLEPPGQVGASEHERRIVDHLAVYDGATTRALRELGNSGSIELALKTMVAAGWVTVAKVGNAHQHSLTDDGRDHYEVDE